MSFVPANPYESFFSGQGRRSYNNVPDTKQFSFIQAFNPNYDNGNGLTGQFQPLTTNNQGALRVDVGSGITVNMTGVEVVVGNVGITGGNIDVNGFSTLTGQINTLNAAVAVLTGSVSWRKVKTAGYAGTFNASATPVLVNKVQGFTKTNTQPSFIQLFDSASTPIAGDNPDFVVAVQTNNSWFIDLAEAGVVFTNGLQVVNSTTADIYTAVGASDFIATAVLK